MKGISNFDEWITESLFADADKGATKGIGYGTPEKARRTVRLPIK